MRTLNCFYCSLITSALILLSFNNFAKAEGILKFGADNSLNKMFLLGIENDLIGSFRYQLEGGYLEQGPFGGASFGIAVTKPSYFTKVFFGPAYVYHTDEHLSTPYEFNLDVQVGLRDDSTEIGLGYKHLSNAGIAGQNLGRDFLYVKCSF